MNVSWEKPKQAPSEVRVGCNKDIAHCVQTCRPA